MIEKTIGEIETKIRGAEAVSEERKRELLQLLAKLKTEIYAREKQNLAPLKYSVGELQSSVEGFEQSHPKLVEAVNRVSNMLSNLGI
jgi:malonyl CoA-acyl carrier protein transacylase